MDRVVVVRIPKNSRRHINITVNEWEGRYGCDIREYTTASNGKEDYTYRGIWIPADLLDSVIDGLIDALVNLKESK